MPQEQKSISFFIKVNIIKCFSVFVAFFFFIFLNNAFSQEKLIIDKDYEIRIDKFINKKNCNIHTSSKPYNYSSIKNFIDKDTIYKVRKFKPWFYRKLLNESLFIIDTTNLHVEINPELDINYGSNLNSGENPFKNVRGLSVKGNITDKLFFNTSYFEVQDNYLDYVANRIKVSHVVPGNMLTKPFKENSRVNDYGIAYGSVSYSPSKHFNFQFGHDKNFIGDGYRSLLLSDNAVMYPHLKITANYGKLQYVNMLISFQNRQRPYTEVGGYQKKSASIHYLSYLFGKSLEVGLFEGVIYQVADSTKKDFNFNYINPVIFSKSIMYGLRDRNNVLIGLNLKYKITNLLQVYSQIVIDDIDTKNIINSNSINNKTGYQIGMKWFDVFGINNLYLQNEYNKVRPYTYAHIFEDQSYTHFGQSLTHPQNANFHELVTRVNYFYKRFEVMLKTNIVQVGKDTILNETHWGNNLFLSDLYAENNIEENNHKFLQGLKSDIFICDLKLSYTVNPKSNLRIYLGYFIRNEKNIINKLSEGMVYFGIQTNFRNQYLDF